MVGQTLCNSSNHFLFNGKLFTQIAFLFSALRKFQKEGDTERGSPKEEVLGPPLPPGFKQTPDDSGEDDDDDDTYGPSLPPGFKGVDEESDEDDSFGPPLPPGHKMQEVSSEEEGEIIGPLPPSAADGTSRQSIVKQFEERSKRMKDKLEGKVKH